MLPSVPDTMMGEVHSLELRQDMVRTVGGGVNLPGLILIRLHWKKAIKRKETDCL
jgi:hypothetical protein